MAIDPERLLHHAIPEVRQRLTKRETILYALSIGLGQDPLDERQLRFVDHHKDLVAVPSMATVLAYPGPWMRDPATGIDYQRVLHGEQEIVLHRPLPVEGDIIGCSRVAGLVDKGVGKGALLYVEKQLIDASTGELIATTLATNVLRGDGGFGGSQATLREAHRLPQTPPDIIVDLATRPEQALLYRLHGDDNPLHADPRAAAEAGFPRPILHGLCSMGIVTHALLAGLLDYRPERFAGLALRFSAPVLPGETITTEMWRDGSFRASVVERGVLVVTNGRLRIA